MPSSTRKWRKQQKEYNRRRRQATRRAEEARQKAAEAEAKRIENERMYKLQTAFGITAAQGFGRNIFSGILASSKGQAANNLTRWVRERRLREAPRLRAYKRMRNKMEEYPDLQNEKLLVAIFMKDPEIVHYLLQEPDTDVSKEFVVFGLTPLEYALTEVKDLNMEFEQWTNDDFDEDMDEVYENLHTIIQLLMNTGSPIRPKTLALIWEQPYDEIYRLLDTYPVFKEKTIEFQAQIPPILQADLVEVEREITEIEEEEDVELEVERNNNGDPWVYKPLAPEIYYITTDFIKYGMIFLQRFIETYNPESGEYTI